MKLVYTDQAIASLQECMDFFPPEVPSEKVNEIRDRILAKTDKLLVNLTSDSTKNTLLVLVS